MYQKERKKDKKLKEAVQCQRMNLSKKKSEFKVLIKKEFSFNKNLNRIREQHFYNKGVLLSLKKL